MVFDLFRLFSYFDMELWIAEIDLEDTEAEEKP